MARVQTSVSISRPAEEVFDHWADGRLYNDWTPGAIKKDVRMVTPGTIGVGSRFRGTFKGAGEVEYEIVEYERPRRLAMITHAKIGDLRHTITCEQRDGATQVTEVGEAHFKGIFKLLGPFLISVFKKSFADNDRALKQYLEARAGQA